MYSLGALKHVGVLTIHSAVYKDPNATYPRLLPDLTLPDADTLLLFLEAGDINYFSPTNDPWFNATLPRDRTDPTMGFYRNEIGAPMACATTRLFCNPDLPEATGCINPYKPAFQAQIAQVWSDPDDQAALRPLFALLVQGMYGDSITFYSRTGLPLLISQETVRGDNQVAVIAGDRWKAEMEYIYQATLASIQSITIEHARGFWIWPTSVCDSWPCKKLCNNQVRVSLTASEFTPLTNTQRIKSSRHYSFSVAGLITIFVVGGVFMLLALFLEDILDLVAKKTSLRHNEKFLYGHAEWRTNSTLQLQRIAHESLGLGTWSRTNEAIPVTEYGDALGVYRVSDPEHPRLVVPSMQAVSMEEAEKVPQKSAKAQYTSVPTSEESQSSIASR